MLDLKHAHTQAGDCCDWHRIALSDKTRNIAPRDEAGSRLQNKTSPLTWLGCHSTNLHRPTPPSAMNYTQKDAPATAATTVLIAVPRLCRMKIYKAQSTGFREIDILNRFSVKRLSFFLFLFSCVPSLLATFVFVEILAYRRLCDMADFGTLLSKIVDVVMGNGDTGRARVGVLLDGTAGQAPVMKQVELGSPAHNAGCYRATDYYPLPTCRLELSSFGVSCRAMFRSAQANVLRCYICWW
jgi:hypothetical protein